METSTYGAELVAFRLAVEQLLDIQNKLRMMGIKVGKTSQILGDNKAVIIDDFMILLKLYMYTHIHIYIYIHIYTYVHVPLQKPKIWIPMYYYNS